MSVGPSGHGLNTASTEMVRVAFHTASCQLPLKPCVPLKTLDDTKVPRIWTANSHLTATRLSKGKYLIQLLHLASFQLLQRPESRLFTSRYSRRRIKRGDNAPLPCFPVVEWLNFSGRDI